jgi:hypothetical protein
MIAGCVKYCSKLQTTPLRCTKCYSMFAHRRVIFKPHVLYILDVRGITNIQLQTSCIILACMDIQHKCDNLKNSCYYTMFLLPPSQHTTNSSPRSTIHLKHMAHTTAHTYIHPALTEHRAARTAIFLPETLYTVVSSGTSVGNTNYIGITSFHVLKCYVAHYVR